jgi:hypothetical protein
VWRVDVPRTYKESISPKDGRHSKGSGAVKLRDHCGWLPLIMITACVLRVSYHHCSNLPFRELDLARYARCFRKACAVLIANDHEITCSSTSQNNEDIVKSAENFQILES